MSNERVFKIWAPPGGIWSGWVKPVLFSCMGEDDPPPGNPAPALNTEWVPNATEGFALVLDLPGYSGVTAALALATGGYRPVPLYNALAGPAVSEHVVDRHHGPNPIAVDVRSIVTALQTASHALAKSDLPANAPPAFLLDANRRGTFDPKPGDFDNRSVNFFSDFPSPDFFKSHGIRGVVLVQATGSQPQEDLAHTILRWREAGLIPKLKRLDVAGSPVAFEVASPSILRRIWEDLAALIGLRYSPQGGFGRQVPEPGSMG